eukprot:SAG31_NODE_3126_length_4646_cov_6.852210_4_plen_103_part_00
MNQLSSVTGLGFASQAQEADAFPHSPLSVIDLAPTHEKAHAVGLNISAASESVDPKAMESITTMLARITKQQDAVLDEVKRLGIAMAEQSARLAALETKRER